MHVAGQTRSEDGRNDGGDEHVTIENDLDQMGGHDDGVHMDYQVKLQEGPRSPRSRVAEKRNSWGGINVDAVKEDDGEYDRLHQLQGCEIERPVRRSSWDHLDLSERLEEEEDASDSPIQGQKAFSFIPGPPTGNIVLVGKLDDAVLVGKLDDAFLVEESEEESKEEEKSTISDARTKSALKGLSDRLGLMSPFKVKKTTVLQVLKE
jgi:hypothetical protein